MIMTSFTRMAASRRSRGESLTEVLVAILVSGLAILMLATVISVAANTNQRSREAMDDYFAAANGVAMASLANAEGTVTLEPSGGGSAVPLSDDAISVEYTVSDETQNSPVVMYEEKDES